MNDQKWVITHEGKYLMGARLAPVPYEFWTTQRSEAMEWDSEADACRALRALKLDKQGAKVSQCFNP